MSARAYTADRVAPRSRVDVEAWRPGSARGYNSVVEDVPEEVSRAALDPRLRVGRYILLGELGRGGMGAVYRAWDPQLRQRVALKILLEPGAATLTERFLREANAAGRLAHAGIVKVLDAGTHGEKPFLVMELVDGENFGALLRRGVALREAVNVVREVALALAHAHAEGVVHRDVKPANVLVDRAGRARLVDFGLVRIVGAKSLTMTGQVLGTPGYMAPEQVAGERHRQGPPSDVYSLGAMLYRILTGKTPFEGQGVAQILFTAPEHPRKLDADADPHLSGLALACLAPEPEKRPTAADLAEDLGRFLEGRGKRGPRRGAIAVVAVALVVAAVATTAVLLAAKPGPPPADATAPPLPAPKPATPPPPAAPRRPLGAGQTLQIGPRGRLGDDAPAAGPDRGSALAIDPGGHRLFVGIDNRILVYRLTEKNTLEPGDPLGVLGKPDFEPTTPGRVEDGFAGLQGLAYDATRKLLFGVDVGWHRVLVFEAGDDLPRLGARPVYVLGQTARDGRGRIDFTVIDHWNGPFGLKEPMGVAFADDRVYVSSSDQDRVLVFRSDKIDENTRARMTALPESYLGRYEAAVAPKDDRRPTSASSLRDPQGLAAGGEWVFVSDVGNDRVLGYTQPLPTLSDIPAAALVLGQKDFDAHEEKSPPTKRTLSRPTGLALDVGRQMLYVVDEGHFRVLAFDVKELAKERGLREAAFVLGQDDLDSAKENAGTDGLAHPHALALDPESGRLFVGDVKTGALTTFRRQD
jgi:serine/threonine-protein kinase